MKFFFSKVIWKIKNLDKYSMKKIILIGLSLILSVSYLSAQRSFSMAFNINSMWGKWIPVNNYILGDYGDFVIVESEYTHPSNYLVRITLNNFELAKKSDYKKRKKNNEWYEYSGTIEYFECSDYNTAKTTTMDARIKSGLGFGFLAPSAYDKNLAGFRTIRKPAIIRIAPYKEKPIIYNIFFENYGIGIDMRPPFGR